MTEIHWMSAGSLAAAFGERKLSPVEVTKHYLARIEKLNPALNAIYYVDSESALIYAKASADRWRKGTPLSPLDGVPMTVKDALGTKGWPSYRGSIATGSPHGTLATSDAPSVARLREGGAVLLGKSTMCDFGILAAGYSSKHGITRNPWNLALNPGGSSSGGAVSVAAGFNPVVVGTDIVGSIRLPAAFCGLFGFKPSQGRVPYYPPNNPALVAGPISRNVEDAAIMMNLITAPDATDFTALPPVKLDYRAAINGSVQKCRVGVITSLGFGIQPSDEVLAKFKRATTVFQSLGCELTAVDLSFSAEQLAAAEAFYKTRCYTEFMNCPEEARSKATVIETWTRTVESLSARDIYEAMNSMRAMRERVVNIADKFDFLLLPSVHIPAFDADRPAPDGSNIFEPWCNTFLFNLTEQPASSLPCGFASNGSPIGIQVIGRRFDDIGVMRMSAAFEREVGEFQHPPVDNILN